MSEDLPWNSIGTPKTGYLWRRHRGAAKHVFWWGKDNVGRPVLLFQLTTAERVFTLERRQPSVAGLDIEFVVVDNGKFEGLKVTLLTSDYDIFHSLCLTLIAVADAVEAETQALASVITHVERWQYFLAAAKRDVLTAEEVRGLYAEVVLINQLIDDYALLSSEVIEAWEGPLGRPQDFRFTEGFIEVKAVGGRYANAILISSEHQLDVVSAPLCLVAIELKEGEDALLAQSLNQLIVTTLRRLGDERKLFEDRLMIAGYIAKPEYDFPAYQVGHTSTFMIDDNFPSICASKLRAGLSNVKYRVDLAEASSSRIPQLNLWAKTGNG